MTASTRQRRRTQSDREMRSLCGAVPSLGIDIVEIKRVARLARRNARFLSRVFSPEEIRYCRDKKKKWQHFAVRFAAKEAVWKALGRPGLDLKDISIRRAVSGRPSILLEGRPAPYIQISLTHTESYAAAVALFVKTASRKRKKRA